MSNRAKFILLAFLVVALCLFAVGTWVFLQLFEDDNSAIAPGGDPAVIMQQLELVPPVWFEITESGKINNPEDACIWLANNWEHVLELDIELISQHCVVTYAQRYLIQEAVQFEGRENNLLIGHTYLVPPNAPQALETNFYTARCEQLTHCGQLGEFEYVVYMSASSEMIAYVDVLVKENGREVFVGTFEVLQNTYLLFIDPDTGEGEMLHFRE